MFSKIILIWDYLLCIILQATFFPSNINLFMVSHTHHSVTTWNSSAWMFHRLHPSAVRCLHFTFSPVSLSWVMVGHTYSKTFLRQIPRSRITESKARNISKALDKCGHLVSSQLPQFTLSPDVHKNSHFTTPCLTCNYYFKMSILFWLARNHFIPFRFVSFEWRMRPSMLCMFPYKMYFLICELQQNTIFIYKHLRESIS